MANQNISVEYNQELEPFSKLLEQIDRPGHFVVSGTWTGPLPSIQVEGVGRLAFPLLSSQAAEIAAAAEEAPYGRGEDTVYDPDVRRTRQLAAEKLRIRGRQWQDHFQEILQLVVDGLGCGKLEVEAELYKMLLYETGGFFAPHRDTEKAEGMFATLVISLPSPHKGGDLLVSHGGETEIISLMTEEASELCYAAFYADCVHEVRPVETGNRLCLVYNLVHRPKSKKKKTVTLTAPDYVREEKELAKQLSEWTATADPGSKIVWLLEHAYTPAGLCFATLKGVDAARAGVLHRAAETAGCDLYLGILHIEESGPAEILYSDYDWDRGYRYRYHGLDDEEEDEDEDDEQKNSDYEVIEVSCSEEYISDWRTPNDEPIGFDRVPLMDGELLPEGALDDEIPDDERVTEATGNEGASFERSYLRAALILWPRDRTVNVLMAAGTGAAVLYLERLLSETDLSDPQKHARAIDMARAITSNWGQPTAWEYSYRDSEMDLMLCLLGRIGEVDLIISFIESIIAERYEVGINDGLVECFFRLDLEDQKRLGQALIRRMMAEHIPVEGIAFFHTICSLFQMPELCQSLAAELLAGMPKNRRSTELDRWAPPEKRKAMDLDGVCITKLFEALRIAQSARLIDEALEMISRHPTVYPPDTMLIPALQQQWESLGKDINDDRAWKGLWQIAAKFLLARSSHTPAPPADWSLPVKEGCNCADCRALMKFAADPVLHQQRFPLRKERRMHLHQRIDRDDLDMTHETERRGSPYVLVCTKTRRTFQKRKVQYKKDLESMTFLAKTAPKDEAQTVHKLKAAQSG